MSTITQTLYLFTEKKSYNIGPDGDYVWEPTWVQNLLSYKASDSDDLVFIKEVPVSFETVDDFNPTLGQLAALEAAKTEVLRQYTERVAELNDRIGKLQAITFEATT